MAARPGPVMYTTITTCFLALSSRPLGQSSVIIMRAPVRARNTNIIFNVSVGAFEVFLVSVSTESDVSVADESLVISTQIGSYPLAVWVVAGIEAGVYVEVVEISVGSHVGKPVAASYHRRIEVGSTLHELVNAQPWSSIDESWSTSGSRKARCRGRLRPDAQEHDAEHSDTH
jgi:hypothetical protein